MKYINTSRRKRIINIGGINTWVTHKQVVDLTDSDIKKVKPYMISLDEYRALKKKYRKAKIDRQTKEAGLKVAKKKSVKVATKPVKNKVVKVPTAAELRTQRAELKTALSKKTKGDLMEFATNVLDMVVKNKDKKDVIINKALIATKKIGYAKVINKA